VRGWLLRSLGESSFSLGDVNLAWQLGLVVVLFSFALDYTFMAERDYKKEFPDQLPLVDNEIGISFTFFTENSEVDITGLVRFDFAVEDPNQIPIFEAYLYIFFLPFIIFDHLNPKLVTFPLWLPGSIRTTALFVRIFLFSPFNH
jgi:hypothetical protein